MAVYASGIPDRRGDDRGPATGPVPRGWKPHAIAILAGTIMMLLAVGLGLTTRAAVHHESHRLLDERANELNLVFTVSINSINSSLSELGGVLKATDGSTHGFDVVAADDIAAAGTTNPPSFAWLAPVGGGFRVQAAQGTAFAVGQVISDDRVATLNAAMGSKQLVPTPVFGSDRRLGFALGPPAAPAGTVLYREAMLGPVAAPRQASTAPFRELDVALYATPTANPDQVLVTTSKLPLGGDVVTKSVPVGSTSWLLATSARRPLAGRASVIAPWVVFGAGLLAAVLVGLAVEVETRRQDTAEELHRTERRSAEALQRSLLPELPEITGLDIAARYLPSASGLRVGGDWFDVFPVEGDRLGLVIGDVMGHDVVAAAAMAQIRAALRAYGLSGDDPAVVLDRLEVLIREHAMTPLLTVFYGILEPPDVGGSRRLRFSNAGHLPPFVRDSDGRVRAIGADQSVVIAGLPIPPRTSHEERLEPGSALVLFTDGLVEGSRVPLNESLERLQSAVTRIPPDQGAEGICDGILGGTRQASLQDDVAVLVVQVMASAHPVTRRPAAAVAATPEGS